MPCYKRLDENEVGLAVAKYLEDAGGEATIRQIRRALPQYADLTISDKVTSRTRPGEELWEQQVRNLVCHRNSEGNLVWSGLLIYRPGRLALKDGPQYSLL